MKKIILTPLLWGMAVVAFAQATPGTDILSVTTLTENGFQVPPENDWSSKSYVSPSTGTEYMLTNLSDDDGDLYFSSSLGVRNTEAGCYLKEIRFKGVAVNEWGSTGFTVYAGNEPVSTSPFMQTGIVTLPIDPETFTATADAPYRYLGIWTYEAKASEIEIVWSDEAPVATAAKPVIILESSLGCPAGSIVSIDSDTTEASIEVRVSKGSDILMEETLPNPCSITLTGEIGDRITVEARAVAEGWTASDWAKRTYTITAPMLMEPEINLSSYSSEVVLGQEVIISNPNDAESTLWYSVCGADPMETTESRIVIKVDGNIGDEWSVSAWCTAEGYDESSTLEWEGAIATNVCPAPYCSPEPGEYAAGTKISISARYPAQSVTYRINGGEWITSTSLWDTSVILEEDMRIEAYASASAPYVDSEVYSAAFTVERISDKMDVITCGSFGQVDSSAFATYTTAMTDNGAVYTLTGRDMSDGMFINGEGDIATVSSVSQISRMKIDARFGNTLRVYLSNSEISGPDNSLDSVTVVNGEYASGEWIVFDKEDGYSYFYITTDDASMANVIDRVVVDYDLVSAVSSLYAEQEAVSYYDLTGRKVEKPSKGIFIRLQGKKAEKIYIK